MKFIGTGNHNNYSTITVIILDYPFCIPFFLYFSLLYFLVILAFHCCAYASIGFCVLSFLSRLLASKRRLNTWGNVLF